MVDEVFYVGSMWIDQQSPNEGVVQVVGEGVVGMPEVKKEDGTTYFANARALTPYDN